MDRKDVFVTAVNEKETMFTIFNYDKSIVTTGRHFNSWRYSNEVKDALIQELGLEGFNAKYGADFIRHQNIIRRII